MAAVIGALRADLSASVAKFEDDMGRASKAIEKFGQRAGRVSDALQGAGQRMTLAITAPFLALAVTSAKAAAESRDAMAQVEDRLRTMGDASGKTAVQLEQSAKKLQRLSTFDDDDILRDVTTTLLTFGAVAGEQFDRAQRAAVDYATAMKKDLASSSVMVGKALNDPIKGMTQLGRAGVQFTESQKAAAKAFVATGDVASAQGIILSEFERQFMGAGAAARAAVPGSDTIDAWRDFQESIGEVVLRFLDKVTPVLTRILDGFNNLSPGVQEAIVVFTAIAAAIGPVLWALGAFAGAIANLAPTWAAFVKLFSDAMLAANITSVGTAIRALASFLGPIAAVVALVVASLIKFRGIFTEVFAVIMGVIQSDVMPAFQALGAAFSDLFSELQSGPLAEFLNFVMWIVAEVVGLFLKVLGGGIAKAIGVIAGILTVLVKAVTGVVKIVKALLSGDFAGAWESAKDTVSGMASTMIQIVENLIPGFRDAVMRIQQAVKEWIADGIRAQLALVERMFPGLVDSVRSAAQGAVAWAARMYAGFKSWIGDKLGPLIKWAQDRIRELNSLFGWITRRQQSLQGQPRPAAAEPTPQPRGQGGAPIVEDTAPPSGGGGGGGRAGGSASSNRADDLKKASDKLRESLEDVQDKIDQSFDRRALPRSIQQADELRKRIADLSTEAREAGVDISTFAGTIETLQGRIRELEVEGLAAEAEAFAREVRDLAADVTDFSGGLSPLAERLRDVDEAYASLRTDIEDGIEANRALAGANEQAAAAMVVLEGQLARLEAAHLKARDAAMAQANAEREIADLQARASEGELARNVRDANAARGGSPLQSAAQREMQAVQDDLDEKRQAALIQLLSMEEEQRLLREAGDLEAADRLQGQIDLQRQLYDIVAATTAGQIIATEQLGAIWDEAVSGVGSALGQMVTDFRGGVDSLKKAFAKMITDFLTQKAQAGVSNLFSRFAGGFAEGGTLKAGEWGIAGEVGPEPIFAGSRPLTVLSNEEATSGGKGGGGVYVDARGAGPREVDELRRWAEGFEATFDRRVVDASNMGMQRGQIRPPNF